MNEGSKVILKPTAVASDDLRDKVAALGDVVGKVLVRTDIGVCVVQLPPGVTIPGYSIPLGKGPAHHISLHESHLQLAA